MKTLWLPQDSDNAWETEKDYEWQHFSGGACCPVPWDFSIYGFWELSSLQSTLGTVTRCHLLMKNGLLLPACWPVISGAFAGWVLPAERSESWSPPGASSHWWAVLTDNSRDEMASWDCSYSSVRHTFVQAGAWALFVFGLGSGLCPAPCGGKQKKCAISN